MLGGGRGLRRGWEGPLHDLSAWRVTVPELIAAPEPDNPRRSYAAFLVEVRRVDVLESTCANVVCTAGLLGVARYLKSRYDTYHDT